MSRTSRRQFVGETLKRKDVGHCAESAQRRGAPWHFRYEMVDDPLGGNVVEWFAIACRAAAGCLGHVDRCRNGRRIRQSFRSQEIGAAARPALMRAAPNFGRPVEWMTGFVKLGAYLHDHRRADRLESEFILPPPAHPDGPAWHSYRDHRGIRGRDSILAPGNAELKSPMDQD